MVDLEMADGSTRAVHEVGDEAPIQFECPVCGARHVRGFSNGVDRFRCLGSLRQARELVEVAIRRATGNINLAELADGLADLDYVVEGTRLEFGIDGEPIAEIVHIACMAKLAVCANCDGRGCGQTIKPEGWKPPDIEGEIVRQQQCGHTRKT
jgi:predicted HAD superfamily Cof-like phosphohydrolase